MDRGNLIGLMARDLLVVTNSFTIITGTYLNDVKQGYGEFYWSDGRVYKG